MASVTGDDREWQLSGYGVLGTGTPRTIPTQDGTADVDSYGVWGLLGTPDDIGGIVDEVTSNESFGPPLRAAIVGRNALADQAAAIYGEATPLDAETSSFGFIAGRSPYAGEVTGVFGQGGTRGVIGIAAGTDAIGVYGGSVGGAGIGVFGDSQGEAGVVGRTNSGIAVLGESVGSGLAGRFVGNVEVTGSITGDVDFTGTMRVARDVEVSGDIRLVGGGDVAEEFEVDPSASSEPGTVMVIDDAGHVRPSSEPYDRRVAGVVAGAGTLRPGLVLDGVEGQAPTARLALVGRTFCKATAEEGPIGVGDLLTTSATAGHAMRADDPVSAFGSVIGKALAPLRVGCALIPILIALQ